MWGYIARRLLLAVPTALGAVTLVFVVVHVLPGDPIQLLTAEHASPENIKLLTHEFGLDKPLWLQYLFFLGQLLRGNLGTSIMDQSSVTSEIATYLPPTLELTLLSLSIAIVVGSLLGVVAALGRGTLVDMFATVIAVVGVSMPVFWLGLLLIIMFSINVRWFPAGGTTGTLSWVLPSLALSSVSLGVIARMVRSSMLEVLGQDYIRTARAKGSGELRLLLRHALRNAMLPVITIVGLQFGYLLGGAVITETIFSWPGMGRLLVNAIESRDYPLIQGAILVYAITFILINLFVDLCYSFIDPRIRYE